MRLSVILPSYNEAKYISTQLNALSRQSWTESWEMIVSDNGSSDGTQEIVRSYQRRLGNLRIVDSSDKRGAAHARNVGAFAAEGDWLAFCDADDEVASNWVAAIGAALSKNDFVASRWECTKLNERERSMARKCTQGEGLQKYWYPPYLDHSGGCGLAVKRTLHERVGGFDESMLCLEDTDYCWRIQLQGTRLHFARDAVVHIRYPETNKENALQARLWGEYNVLLYKKFRDKGMPPLPLRKGLQAWFWLAKKVRKLKQQKMRQKWLREFNWRLGRLIGSIKYRVIAL